MATITGLTADAINALISGINDAIDLKADAADVDSAVSAVAALDTRIDTLEAASTGVDSAVSALDTRIDALEANPAPETKTWLEAIRFLVSGTVDAATNFPNAYVPIAADGQTVTVKGVKARIESGTSIDVQLRRNGANLGSSLNDVGSGAWASQTLNQALSDADELDVVLSDPQGTPKDLAVIVILQHTVV